MSLSEMREELRMLRKESVKPVSKMRKHDISAEIERLKHGRETTPVPAATKVAKSVKVAKEEKEEKPKKMSKKDDPCWDGYEMVGTKKKGGKTVPNCVPEEKEKKSVKKVVKKEVEEKKTIKKPAKGSSEMAEKMAHLRSMRKSKASKKEETSDEE